MQHFSIFVFLWNLDVLGSVEPLICTKMVSKKTAEHAYGKIDIYSRPDFNLSGCFWYWSHPKMSEMVSDRTQFGLIRLYRITCFFQFWCGTCSFFKMFSHGNDMFEFVLTRFRMFLHFLDQIWRASNFAKICPIFSTGIPMWDHFAHFWMISVPRTTA